MGNHYRAPEPRADYRRTEHGAAPVRSSNAMLHAHAFFQREGYQLRQASLLEASGAAERENLCLVDCLLTTGRTLVKPSEEIEMKLAVRDTPDNLVARFEEYQIESHNFVQSTVTRLNVTRNHYFGTNDAERFVVIQNDEHWALKVKGQPRNPKEMILHRPETLTSIKGTANILEIAQIAVEGCQPTSTRYIGVLEKEKAERYVINRDSGHVYTLTLAVCRAEGRDPLSQLEIEYAGRIPDFPQPKVTLEEDITAIANELKRNGLQPTRLTKFEWLIGKKEVPLTRFQMLEPLTDPTDDKIQ